MQQYWAGNPDAYDFVGVGQLAKAFSESGIGPRLDDETPDLEKGQKGKRDSAATRQEEEGRQNGSLERQTGAIYQQEPDEQKKRNTLDPLVQNKYGACPMYV